jgi:DnaJ-class molecular chaperone
MVAVSFTAKFAPLEGKKLTLRREAFLQCTPVDESNAALQKFVETIQKGAELSVITTDRIACKPCGGLGFTREAQKGKIEDKRMPCKDCEGTGKIPLVTETKFAP